MKKGIIIVSLFLFFGVFSFAHASFPNQLDKSTLLGTISTFLDSQQKLGNGWSGTVNSIEFSGAKTSLNDCSGSPVLYACSDVNCASVLSTYTYYSTSTSDTLKFYTDPILGIYTSSPTGSTSSAIFDPSKYYKVRLDCAGAFSGMTIYGSASDVFGSSTLEINNVTTTGALYMKFTSLPSTGISIISPQQDKVYSPFTFWKTFVNNFDIFNQRVVIEYSTPFGSTLYDFQDTGAIATYTTSTGEQVDVPVQHSLYFPDLGTSAHWHARALLKTSSTLETIASSDYVDFYVLPTEYTTGYPTDTGVSSSTLVSSGFDTATSSPSWCVEPSSTSVWWNPLSYGTFFNWQHLAYGGCKVLEFAFSPHQQVKGLLTGTLDTFKTEFPFSLVFSLGQPTGLIYSNVPTSSSDLILHMPSGGDIPIFTSSTLLTVMSSSTKTQVFTAMKYGFWSLAVLASIALIF